MPTTRPSAVRRLLPRLLVALLLGLLLSTTLAAVAALSSPPKEFGLSENGFVTLDGNQQEVGYTARKLAVHYSAFDTGAVMAAYVNVPEESPPRTRVPAWTLPKPIPIPGDTHLLSAATWAYGWPSPQFRAAVHRWTPRLTANQEQLVSSGWHLRFRSKPPPLTRENGWLAFRSAHLPLRVYWPGLIANALVSAVPVFLLGVGIRSLRRQFRRRRGRCPSCNYPLVSLTSERCPECGVPFTPHPT
jgi:hypothetical protein